MRDRLTFRPVVLPVSTARGYLHVAVVQGRETGTASAGRHKRDTDPGKRRGLYTFCPAPGTRSRDGRQRAGTGGEQQRPGEEGSVLVQAHMLAAQPSEVSGWGGPYAEAWESGWVKCGVSHVVAEPLVVGEWEGEM